MVVAIDMHELFLSLSLFGFGKVVLDTLDVGELVLAFAVGQELVTLSLIPIHSTFNFHRFFITKRLIQALHRLFSFQLLNTFFQFIYP